MKKLTLLLILSYSFVGSTYANSYYWVTDQLDIPIRSEKDFGNNIIRLIQSGSKLKLVESTDDGWSRINFEQTKGWIRSLYLTSEVPSRIQLNLRNFEIEGLKKEIEKLKKQVEFLEIRKKALSKEEFFKIRDKASSEKPSVKFKINL